MSTTSSPAPHATPTVSVIIPTYRNPHQLEIQLEALATQEDPPVFEVVVADNAGDASTREVVGRWSDPLDIRWLDASARRGPAFARNAGIQIARADKLAFCDDDDVVAEDWVRAASRYLDMVEFVSGAGFELPDRAFSSVAAVRQQVPPLAPFTPAHPSPCPGDYPILLGGNFAIRRERMEELGGFDPAFDPGAEDKELALRNKVLGGVLYKGDSLRLAVRLRPTDAGDRKRRFVHGRTYMKLVDTYGLWRSSPVVNRPDFRIDFLRAVASWVRTWVRPGADRRAVEGRIALRAGQLVGWLQAMRSRVGKRLRGSRRSVSPR